MEHLETYRVAINEAKDEAQLDFIAQQIVNDKELDVEEVQLLSLRLSCKRVKLGMDAIVNEVRLLSSVGKWNDEEK